MRIDVRDRSDPVRCPCCLAGLGDEALLGCPRCGCVAHAVCLVAHGRCPVLGCASVAAAFQGVSLRDPVHVASVTWAELVSEAAPWLDLGAALADAGAWGTDAPGPGAEPEDAESGSSVPVAFLRLAPSSSGWRQLGSYLRAAGAWGADAPPPEE